MLLDFFVGVPAEILQSHNMICEMGFEPYTICEPVTKGIRVGHGSLMLFMGCDQKVRAKAGSDPPTSEIYCDGDCEIVYDDNGTAIKPTCAYIVMLKATGNLTEEEQKPGCHCFFAGPLLGFKGGKVDTTAGLAWDATQKGKYFDAPKKPRKEIKGSGKWIKVDGSKDVQRAWVLG